MAALQGAVTLKEVHNVALTVSQDLHLNVAGAQHCLFKEDSGIAEGGVGLSHSRFHSGAQVFTLLNAAHTAAATTGNSLDEDGEANFFSLSQQLLNVCTGLGGLEHRDTGTAGGLQRLNLVTGQFQNLRRGADEGDTGVRGGAR